MAYSVVGSPAEKTQINQTGSKRTASENHEKDRLFAQESLSFFVENRERTRNFHHDLQELNHKSRWKAKQGCDILVSELQKSKHKKLTIKNTIVHYDLFLWAF